MQKFHGLHVLTWSTWNHLFKEDGHKVLDLVFHWK